MSGKKPASTQVHPYALVFSLYGKYVLPRGGEIWIGSLIRALAALDFSAGTVRTLASRMQRKGYLQSRRLGRRSFYRLTDKGLKEVHVGGQRAFSLPGSEWDERWTVVTYSIPEKHRERRNALRNALKCWGFGALAPGTWISPRPLSPETEKELRRLGTWQYVEIFRAEHLGPSDPSTLVAQAWPQLTELGVRYQAYISEYELVLRRFEAGTLGNRAAFAAQLQSLCDLVMITLDDPGLPSQLLSEDWPRPAARSLYKELQQALAEPAERFFDRIYRTTGERHGQRRQSKQ